MVVLTAVGALLHYWLGWEFAPLVGLFGGLLLANFIPPRGGSCAWKDSSRE